MPESAELREVREWLAPLVRRELDGSEALVNATVATAFATASIAASLETIAALVREEPLAGLTVSEQRIVRDALTAYTADASAHPQANDLLAFFRASGL